MGTQRFGASVHYLRTRPLPNDLTPILAHSLELTPTALNLYTPRPHVLWCDAARGTFPSLHLLFSSPLPHSCLFYSSKNGARTNLYVLHTRPRDHNDDNVEDDDDDDDDDYEYDDDDSDDDVVL